MPAFLTIDPNHARPNVPQTPLEALQIALEKAAPTYVPTSQRVQQAGQGGSSYDAAYDPSYPVSPGYQQGTWATSPTRTASVMIPGMTQAQKQAINYIDPRIPASVYSTGGGRQEVASVPGSMNGSAIIKDTYGRATPEMSYFPVAPKGAITSPGLQAIEQAAPPLPRVRPAPPVSVTVRGGNTISAPAGGGSYTVKKGDTFWGISQRTGVPVSVLMANAGSTDPTKLQIGTKLNLSSSPTRSVSPMSPSPVMIAARQSSSPSKGKGVAGAQFMTPDF